MQKYLTGLVFVNSGKIPKFPYKARNWSYELTTTAVSRRASTHFGARRCFGREIVVRANGEAVAAKALFLAEASLALLNGGNAAWRQFGLDQLYLIPYTKSSKENVSGRTMLETQSIPLACIIAIRAARTKSRVYALANLYLSYRMFSVHPMDMEPGPRLLPRPRPPAEQICLANALLLASTALEWLGLNIRASRENPSFINGKWNPAVKNDLEIRLKSAGLDLTEKFDWAVRGSKTKLEAKRPLRAVCPAPWSDWHVRDVEVEVIDAIAHLDWLRDKLAAHRSDLKLLAGLGVYEIGNAQHLVRRILLEEFGLWKQLDEPRIAQNVPHALLSAPNCCSIRIPSHIATYCE